ncbi:hypothetical protein NVP1262O_23 [Vibrio phage 1.262.O._10N.286.51.A9]|nr:hypothetical protein NVP1262O_23 [Vibrio phage 1.262.O._10N.286.51.A9]
MFLPVECRNEDMIDMFISLMKKKTDMFHYTDEDRYKDSFLNGDFLVWIFGTVLVVGKPYLSDTKIKGVELDTASYKEEIAHDDFQYCLEYIEEELKANDFFELRFCGRKGWRKIYPSFKELHVTYVKEI